MRQFCSEVLCTWFFGGGVGKRTLHVGIRQQAEREQLWISMQVSSLKAAAQCGAPTILDVCERGWTFTL
jgi:hypothetical protein